MENVSGEPEGPGRLTRRLPEPAAPARNRALLPRGHSTRLSGAVHSGAHGSPGPPITDPGGVPPPRAVLGALLQQSLTNPPPPPPL